jgi:hypothetical protein
MENETDWQSLASIAYPDISSFPCGNCGIPLPKVTRWQILTERADPELLNALATGDLNKFSCVQCGVYGDFGEPILLIDRPRYRSILLYDSRSAPQPEQATRDKMFALLERFPTAELASLREHSVTVADPEGFAMCRDSSDEAFASLIDADHRRTGRRGTFGADRVALICRDAAATGILLVDEFELSDELLGVPEFWAGQDAERIRAYFTKEVEEPSSATARSLMALMPDVFANLHSTYDATNGVQKTMAAVRATAILADPRLNLEPTEREQFELEARPFLSNLEMLRQFLNIMHDNSAGDDPGINFDGHGRKKKLRDAMTGVAGVPATTFAWDDSYVLDPPDEALLIATLLNHGRPGEAHERAVAWEASCPPECRRIAALMRAAAALQHGLPQGMALAEQAIDASLRELERSRKVELNEFLMGALVHRSMANFFSSRGREQESLNENLAALDVYCTVGDHSNIANIAPEVFSTLLFKEKAEEAREISLLVTESPRVLSHMSDHAAIELFRNLALLEPPWLEVVFFADTGDMRVLNRRDSRAVGRETVEARSPMPELSPEVKAEQDRSNIKTGMILEIRIPSQYEETELCLTSFLGNQGLAHLVRRLHSATLTPQDRLALLLCIAQIETPYTASTPGSERLLGIGSVETADELMRLVLSLAETSVGTRSHGDMAAACAFACTTYVDTARRAERLFSEYESDTDSSWLVGYAAQLWEKAMRAGRAAMELERAMSKHRGVGKEVLSDGGTVSDMILKSYPLALETTGAIAEAIEVYAELMPHGERRRSSYVDVDLTHWAQTRMTLPYARFSRCLFSRFRLTGNFDDVIWAGDLLERHRARSLQARGLELTGADIAEWSSSPLRSTAAVLNEDQAVVCLGWHPITERIPGRWIAVGLGGGSSPIRWVQETTPPTILKKVHDWFAERMHEVSNQSRSGSLSAYMDTLTRLVPAEEVLARLADLRAALAVPDGSFTDIRLVAEDYALQLPWPAAAALSGSSPSPTVSVTPTASLIGRPHRPETTLNDRVVISTSLADAAFELADAIEARRSTEACPVEIYDQSDLEDLMDSNVLILLGHGRRDSGLGGFANFLPPCGRAAPRAVILLGCWSAHTVQDLSHREVEGLALSLLAAGAEIVVASLWPVAVPVGCIFVATFLETLAADTSASAAFAVARDTVRTHYSHPAIWSGFTCFG